MSAPIANPALDRHTLLEEEVAAKGRVVDEQS